jgi:hypothetical protein
MGVCEARSQDVQWITRNQELDVVEGSAPSKTKKEMANGVGAGNVGALATLRIVLPHCWKRKSLDDASGLTGTLSGSHSGQAPSRREQWERFVSSHTKYHEQKPQKRRNGDTPICSSGQTALRRKQCYVDTYC